MNEQQISLGWFYKETEITESNIPDGAIGFVYEIIELHTDKRYIGKKLFYSHKYSVKTSLIKSGVNKGQKKKKKTKIIIQSDWQDYYGSSDRLKDAVEKNGKEKYRRTILRFCYTKSELSYFETYEIFKRHALLSEQYYNFWVSCKIHKAHVIDKIHHSNI